LEAIPWNKDQYRERIELDAAIHHLEQGLALGRQVNSLLVLVSGHIALARVKQARGDHEAAQIQLQQAEQVANQLEVDWSWIHTPVTAYLIRLWLGQNQIEVASQAAQAWQQKDDAPMLPGYWTEGQQIALARLFIGQNKYTEALVILEQSAQAAEESGSMGSLIEIFVLQTVVHSALANPDKALRSLQQALYFAEPAGYMRLFIDEGERLAPLLQQAIARNLQAGYATKLLQSIRSETKTGPTSTTSQLLDPLTERESEVLRLIAAGLSNQSIADELVIAHGTVRQHINRIYSKLDVKSRAQAIIKAQDLDLE
jgi:LuxR family maltose regulon positive regulatory protein